MSVVSSQANMAVHSVVIAALRVLTSTSSQELPVKERKAFDTILSSNLHTLGVALREDTKFEILRSILGKSNSENPESITRMFMSLGWLKEPENGNCGDPKESEDGFLTRWKFVHMCLELLKALHESLTAAREAAKVDRPREDEKSKTRGNEAPPLAQDSLSVSDQKTTLTAIQFVVSLGICPNLLAGVGIPLERRSGFAHFVRMDGSFRRNERHLYHCVDSLVSCIQHPSLGSLILSRHLGDILAGLLQICYAPPSSYLELSTACKTMHGNGAARDVTSSASNNGQEAETANSGHCTTSNLDCDRSAITIEPDSQRKAQIVSPADIQHSSSAINEHETPINDKDLLFITAVEREKCSDTLRRLLNRVYQPIVVRELLILQGGSGPSRQNTKQKCLQMVGDGRMGEKGGMRTCLPRTPKWLRDICGNLLSERLMEPHGVQGILRGILEADGGTCTEHLHYSLANRPFP